MCLVCVCQVSVVGWFALANMSSAELLFDLSKHSLSPGPIARNPSGPGGGGGANIQHELKYLLKRLKLKGWKVVINTEPLSSEMLARYQLVVIFMPRLKYSETEFTCLKTFLEEQGGHVMIFVEEGGGGGGGTVANSQVTTNVNYFIEEYGVYVNNDRVIRTSFFKYYNPRVVHIEDGVLNRALLAQANRLRANTHKATSSSLAYVYPFGATLNVARPAVAVLSTGTTSFPASRPTAAFYQHQDKGKLIVLGSGHCLTDKYINNEDNLLLLDVLFAYLAATAGDDTNSFRLNGIDAANPEVADYHMVPDLEVLCNRPLLFLEENEDIPLDYSHLFSRDIKHLSNRSLAKVGSAYDEFQLEKRPLRLIKPCFETPLPPLVPAIYAPIFRAQDKPELELYDLDNEFSSVQNKLTRLANKCGNADLDYFIRQCGLLLGLTSLEWRDNVSKNILAALATKLANFKRVNNTD